MFSALKMTLIIGRHIPVSTAIKMVPVRITTPLIMMKVVTLSVMETIMLLLPAEEPT